MVRGQCLSYGDGVSDLLAGGGDAHGGHGDRTAREGSRRDSARGCRGAPGGAPNDVAIVVGPTRRVPRTRRGQRLHPRRPHWAIRKLFEALAAERPLVAVFEDIHWAEPGLLDLIEHIAEWTRDAPILLIVHGARRSCRMCRPGWGRATGDRHARSSSRSPRTESDQLIAGLLGRSDTPDAVEDAE